jgi:sialate O-acetylesterase
LAKTYGSNDVVFSGPVCSGLKIERNQLRLTFAHAPGGPVTRDGQALTWFEVIDANEGGFVPGKATIEGNTVMVSSPEVKQPVAVRYAWSMLAEPNLVNRAGLPAGAFRMGEVPKRDLLVMKVPEASQYKLVYELDLAKLGPDIKWEVDNRRDIEGFDRIAYYLELEAGDGNIRFIYVSMDAFTDSLEKIGIPTLASKARFQQQVFNLVVHSNVRGISTGTHPTGGNIEFWPNNYGPGNRARVAHASAQVYDFGDEAAEPSNGYGSMQIHNASQKQTLLAINHWTEGARADIGIGNQPSGNPDWTFAGNAASYKTKRLKILVRPK